MPQATVTLGAKTDGLKTGLNRARADWKAFRDDIKAQSKSMAAESREAMRGGGKDGSMAGAITKGNLYAKAIELAAKAAREAVNNVGELVDASEQLGVSAESIGKLERVFEGSGVQAENLRKGLQKLNDSQSAVKDGNADIAAKFAEFGISADEVKSMKLEDLFFRVADGMKGMSDQGKAGSLALDLIGSKNARMLSVMRGGGEELKKQMSNVSGVISDANSKAIDDAADGAVSAWSATKGFFGQAIGATINAANKVIDDGAKGWEGYKAEVDGAGESTDKAAKSAEDVADAQKESEESAKKARDESAKAVAAAHAQLSDAERQKDIIKETVEAAREFGAIEKENERNAFSALTIFEKQALLLKRMGDARNEEKNARDPGEKHKARVKQAEIQQQLDGVRKDKIERQAMNPQERAAFDHADRVKRRREKWAERVVDAKERDRIDRDFRNGKLTKAQRDAQLADLKAVKGGNKGKETELLQEIRDFIKAGTDKLAAA